MIRWTGLAPWEFEFPFLGSLTSTFLVFVYHSTLGLRVIKKKRRPDEVRKVLEIGREKLHLHL